MIGADIYRYQTVADWAALARNVDFLWVKGTDGGGLAQSPATDRVRQAHTHGIPVGLYHFAQSTPSPQRQADILAAEVDRLDAYGVAPALDLEDPFVPGPAARDFAIAFLRRLVDHHRIPRVAIYGNATMLQAIRPDTWGIPDLVIWCARYVTADIGREHTTLAPYTGRVDVHQYTQRGRLPGIVGHVDLNRAHRSPLMNGGDMAPTNPTAAAVVDALITRLKTDPAARRIFGNMVWEHPVAGRDTQAGDRLVGLDAHQVPDLARAQRRTEVQLAAVVKLLTELLDGPDRPAAELRAALRAGLDSSVVPALDSIAHDVAGPDHADAAAAVIAALRDAVASTGDPAPPAPVGTVPADVHSDPQEPGTP